MKMAKVLSARDLHKLKKCSQLRLIYEAGKKCQAEIYLVGGIIRDLVLKRPLAKDFDFVVKGEIRKLVAELAAQWQAHFFPLDESLDIWRLVLKKGKKKVEMDFSPLPSGDIEADLRERDFTINSLALQLKDLFSKDPPLLIDPLNGSKDLGQRRLRVNDEDALRKDPLRLLRAFRLAAQLNLQIEEHTLDLIKKNKHLLPNSAEERIRAEFFALLNEKRAALFLRELFRVGILEEIFPEIKSWANLPQRPPHDFALLEHAFKTVEAAEFILANLLKILPSWGKIWLDYFAELVEEGVTRRALFKFAAFFHDAGKPDSYSWPPEEKYPRFFDHDQKGKLINLRICQRLKLSRRATKFITEMTAQHMRILSLIHLAEITPRAKYRFFRDLGKEGVQLALLNLADKMATWQLNWQWPLPPDTPDELLRLAKVVGELIRYFHEDFFPQRKKLLLNGREIMEAFNLPPGKRVGELLAQLQEAESKGLIQNKDEAWQFLKAQLSLQSGVQDEPQPALKG